MTLFQSLSGVCCCCGLCGLVLPDQVPFASTDTVLFQLCVRCLVFPGLPPLKFQLGSGGAQSWLLTTYLDEDIRISRGDGGGLFVLIKEGSNLK